METELNLSLCEKIKKYPLYYITKFFIISIIITIIYFIEKLIFIIINFIFQYWFISLLLQIILHLYLLRYFILKVEFPGLSFILSRTIQIKIGMRQATYLYNELNALKSGIDLVYNKQKPVKEIKYLLTIQRNVKNARGVIKYFYKVFSEMKIKFNNLTIDQEIFYQNLANLYNSFEQSEFLKIINGVIKQIRKEKITTIEDLSLSEKEKYNNQKKESEKYIDNINISLDLLLAQIKDYIGEDYCMCSPRSLRNFFKNFLFASLEQFQVELSNYFLYEEKKLQTKDGNVLEYIIIKNNNGNEKNNYNKKLMIICGPNAEPYQIFSRNIELNKYLTKGIDVLCWNYRGYGFSTGKVTFDNIKSDINEIYEDIKKLNIYNAIGVHGISIGGVPCCYLAAQKKEICLLVSDRNFGQIECIAKQYALGKYLLFLYKLLFIPSSRTIGNYIESNALKIILNDPKDEIVVDEGSLKTLLAEEFCNRYLEFNSQNFSDSITNDTNIMKSEKSIELETLDESNNIILTSKYKKRNNSKDNLLNDIIITPSMKDNKTALDVIFSNDKETFINCLINISDALTSEKLNLNKNKNMICNKISKMFKKTKIEDEEYSYLKEEEFHNSLGLIDFIRNKMSSCLKKFKSAGDNLYNLTKKKSRYNQILFIENFFNNLFIWGTYDKKDDYGSVYHSTEYIDFMISSVINMLDLFLSSQEIISFNKIDIIKDIESFYNFIIKMKNNMKYLGIKNKNYFVSLTDGDNYEKELIKLGRGNFVWLSCGHNGLPCVEENMVFKHYLKQSELFRKEKKEEIMNNNNNIDNDDNFGKENIFNDNNMKEDLDTSFSNLA